MTPNEAIQEIDRQIGFLLLSRSIFPYLPEEAVGKAGFIAGEFFRTRGYDVTCTFANAIDEHTRDKVNSIGHWINQNFIIRVHSILESCGLISNKININQQLAGWEEVDLVRRLRHKFGHSSGFCNPGDPDDKRLRLRLVEKFHLRDEDHQPHLFPIPVDHVVVPLAEGCKSYIRASGS